MPPRPPHNGMGPAAGTSMAPLAVAPAPALVLAEPEPAVCVRACVCLHVRSACVRACVGSPGGQSLFPQRRTQRRRSDEAFFACSSPICSS